MRALNPAVYTSLPKVVEIDASDLGYGGILKQVHKDKEVVFQYTSGKWNDTQKKTIPP